MNTSNPRIQIFKAGTHTPMSGSPLEFSEADLQASAAAYSPSIHEAPIVVGHPRHDNPAYGWIKSLHFAEGALEAERDQVDADFAEMVKAGRFKKVSASFYTPDSPNNPVPGVYYLRHVGFLGAQPPAIKGLRQAEFADGEQGVVEFSDAYSCSVLSRFLRGLREWFIADRSLEVADQVVPDWYVTSLEDSARSEAVEEGVLPSPGFSEASQTTQSLTQGDDMSAEQKARLDALEQENQRLKADAEARVTAERAAAQQVRRAQIAAFSEGLVKEGKLLPAERAKVEEVLVALNGTDAVSFGEGDGKQDLTLEAALKDVLSALPKRVEFGEVAKGAVTESVSFAAPGGYSVDNASAELHARAVAYQKTNPAVDFVTAVQAVS